MPTLNIGTSSYTRPNAQLPSARVENYYWEKAVTSENGAVWIPRPALELWRVGTGALRGLFRQSGTLNGDLVAVIGTNAYRIASDGSSTDLGTVGGSGRVSIAGALSGVLIANGEKLLYSTGVPLIELTIPFTKPISVSYLDGFWQCVAGDTFKRYWASDLSPTVWDALNFDAAGEKTDPLIATVVVGGRLWDIGENTIEFRYSTGDNTAPFAVEKGRTYQRGCLARDSIVSIDNTVFWVGDDRIIYRGGSSVPEALSDNYLSELIAAVNSSDVYATGFAWEGHVFYCLTIGNQGTYLYDVTTQKWSKWSTYGKDRWLTSITCQGFDNKPLVGDVETGNLYTLNGNKYSDGDLPIVGIVSAGALLKAQRISINMLRVEMAVGYGLETGQGSNPVIRLRMSRDGGLQFGDWQNIEVGKTGEYSKRVIARRLGQFKPPYVVAEISISDPVPRRISGIYFNEGF